MKFASDTSDQVLDQARLEAEDSRGEQTSGAGQVPLTDEERDRIDFSKGRSNVLHARSVKGIAADASVSDWTAYYDPTLTTDEHQEVMDRAAKEGGGSSQEDPESTTERAARAAQTAKGGQCDHARDHCKHGDPEACEFLTDTCNFDEQEVEQLLAGPQADEGGLPGEAKGALGRSWQGYKGGISRLERELEDALEAKEHAEQAAASINAIRRQHGQEPLEFERLEKLSDRLGAVGETAHEQPGHVETQT